MKRQYPQEGNRRKRQYPHALAKRNTIIQERNNKPMKKRRIKKPDKL